MEWKYRDDTRLVGQLTPVQHTDEHGKEQCGWAEIAGFREIHDADYHNGIRREMFLRGPVVNHNRTVVLDESPNYVRVLHHYQDA